MINWNVVPMWWGESLPYTLFTEMEWIGKLSYMCNDLNTRLTTAEAAISDFDTRLQAAEYQININKSDITNLKDRMDAVESRMEISVDIPTIPTPVDDPVLEIRTYTINIDDMQDYKYIKVSFDYEYISTVNRGRYVQPFEFMIPIDPENSTAGLTKELSACYNFVDPNNTATTYTGAIKGDDGINTNVSADFNGLENTTLTITLHGVYIALISSGTGYFINTSDYPEIKNLTVAYYK